MVVPRRSSKNAIGAERRVRHAAIHVEAYERAGFLVETMVDAEQPRIFGSGLPSIAGPCVNVRIAGGRGPGGISIEDRFQRRRFQQRGGSISRARHHAQSAAVQAPAGTLRSSGRRRFCCLRSRLPRCLRTGSGGKAAKTWSSNRTIARQTRCCGKTQKDCHAARSFPSSKQSPPGRRRTTCLRGVKRGRSRETPLSPRSEICRRVLSALPLVLNTGRVNTVYPVIVIVDPAPRKAHALLIADA